MMNYPDKASRIASKSHASYKAKAYKTCRASLFIESSPVIAEEILALSGKPVLCMDDKLIVADRDGTVTPLIRRFQAEIRSLKQQVVQIENSIPVKVGKRFDRASRLLPSRVRYVIVASARVILNEGWLAFMRRAARFSLQRIRRGNG